MLLDSIYISGTSTATTVASIITEDAAPSPSWPRLNENVYMNMAGSDDDSWKTMFEAADFTVDCQIAGLGEIADVQALYIAHTQAAIDALNA